MDASPRFNGGAVVLSVRLGRKVGHTDGRPCTPLSWMETERGLPHRLAVRQSSTVFSDMLPFAETKTHVGVDVNRHVERAEQVSLQS